LRNERVFIGLWSEIEGRELKATEVR